MGRWGLRLVLLASGMGYAGQSFGQADVPAGVDAKPAAFEVVSIRPAKEGEAFGTGCTADGFNGSGMAVLALLMQVNKVWDYQIVNLPDWAYHDRYNVQAKVGDEQVEAYRKGGKALCLKMVQAVLADRFQLTFRRESRMLNVFDLVVVKGGPRFQESNSASPAGNMVMPGTMTLNNAPMSFLATVLATQVRTPVTDKTGLGGKYDLKMKWTPENAFGKPMEDDGVPLFTAIQDQLGLKLQAVKGPVDTIVVEHLAKPTEN